MEVTQGERDIMGVGQDKFDFVDFGDYLNDIEEQLSPWHTLDEMDEVAGRVEEELDVYNDELRSGDLDTKRKIAVASLASIDMDLLTQDEDFRVRTLALCNGATSSAILAQTVENNNNDAFALMVVAHNPNASLDTLNRIFDLAGGEKEILSAIIANPNCDEVLRFKVENAMPDEDEGENEDW